MHFETPPTPKFFLTPKRGGGGGLPFYFFFFFFQFSKKKKTKKDLKKFWFFLFDFNPLLGYLILNKNPKTKKKKKIPIVKLIFSKLGPNFFFKKKKTGV